jgi:hypothetical protein
MCHAVRRLTGLPPTMLRRRTQASSEDTLFVVPNFSH